MQRTALSPAMVFTVCAVLILAGPACEDADTNVPEVSDYESADRDVSTGDGNSNLTSIDTSEAEEVAADADLAVSPTEITLEGDGDMGSFTASGGTAPYTWSVQDVFRGSIVDSGGASAAYQRSAAGDNAVIVEDATGEKAFGIVDQP